VPASFSSMTSKTGISWFLLCLLLALLTLPMRVRADEAAAVEAGASAPTQMSLLDDEWELHQGDKFVYSVVEEREEPVLLTVNGRGEVLFPLIGLFPAEGKTSRQLAFELKERLEEEFFYRATVVISQREADRNRGRVTVYGEVRNQGELLIPADAPMTLSQSIITAGGFTLDADRSKVAVVADGGEGQRKNYDVGYMLESGNLSGDPLLKADDVVIVSRMDEVESRVYILGAVSQPGLYPVPGKFFTLSQAILRAGGFTRFAKKTQVRLISVDERGEKTERTVDAGKILEGGDRSSDPAVKPGDMIIVDEKMISFTN